MKTKNRKIVFMAIITFCFCIVSMLGTTVSASVSLKSVKVPASINDAIESGLIEAQAKSHWQRVPFVSKSELPTAKGEDVTNEDIVKVACYLAHPDHGFSYNQPGTSVGTCTGFVIRTLRYLQIALPMVSRVGNWDSVYTLDYWDVPGGFNSQGHLAPYGPADYKSSICPQMAQNGQAEFICTIPDGASQSYINSCGVKAGDILLTNTHIAIAYEDADGDILTLGATGDGHAYDPICAMTLVSVTGSKKGDVDVYRVAKAEVKGDLIIRKSQAATAITNKIPLEGAKFKAVSQKDGKEYESNVSGPDGVCQILQIPQGTYDVYETEAPKHVLHCEPFTITIDKDHKIVEVEKEDKMKTIEVTMGKIYTSHSKGITDAKVSGAEFTIYSDEACTQVVTSFETNAEGQGKSISIPTGKYWMKETRFPEGMNPDAVNKQTGVKYKDIVYAIDSNVENQTIEVDNKPYTVENEPYYGYVRVKKQENGGSGTEVSPAVGAVLKLTLKSTKGKANEVSYTAVVNEEGKCEFVNEKLRALGYDATIPYGEYVLSEEKESDNGEHYYYFIQDCNISIKVQNEIGSAIVSDNVVPFYPMVRKVDADTNEEVHMAGFQYKIWRIGSEKLGTEAGWVTQYDTESDKMIDVFQTDDNGVLVLPEKLRAAEYVFYEVDCPKGYYIPEKYRLPANEADYGNYNVSGAHVDATKATLLLPEDQVENHKDVYLEVPMIDPELKGQIKLYKTGEVLTDVTVRNEEVTGEELYAPKYEVKPLKGITFKIYANEDIYSPDGRIKLHSKNDYIGEMTTGEDGYATSKILYLGEYRLEEVPTEGYKTCEDIVVRLTNDDKYNEVKVTPVTAENVRQQLYVKIKKIFEDSMYNDIDLSDKSAVFTVRAKEPIYNYQGNVVIPAGTLVSVIEFTDNHQVSEDVDLPAGTYEIEEVYASEPYERIEEVRTVVLKGDTTGATEVDFEEEFTNDYIKKDLYIIKFSASNFADADVTGLVGERVRADLIDSEIAKFIDEIKWKTPDEVKEIINEKAWITKEGATYAIFKDKACTEPLVNKETNEAIIIQTDISGMYNLSGIAEGVYYVKEIKAPVYTDGVVEIPYQLSEEPVMIDLREDADTTAGSMVFRGLWDESVVYPAIEKTDIFTGEAVPNCTFEVLNADKEVIFHATTNEKGEAGIPIDKIKNGEKYYFKEISAPGVYYKDGVLYELNTDEHEFVADYEVKDGQIIFKNKVHIENYRPISKVTFIKVDAESGELIPNCKFELRSKETDFVKTGVTDENGIYVFENIPYGEYTYTELEAPEEYMIDTTPHDVTIDSETMDLKVPNTLKPDQPDTGDINVVALALIAVACMVVSSVVINKKVRE